MIEKVNTQPGSEVLQASALHDFPWPEDDPGLVEQEVAVWGPEYSALLDSAVGNFRFDMDRFLKQTGDLAVADRVWRLLSAGAFNFNGVEAARAEKFWRDRVALAIEGGEPIQIAYPLVCKIDNPAKRMTLVNCTAGERGMVRFFRTLALLVKAIYEPGVRIHVLSDATLYNGALFVPPPSAYAYIGDFAALIVEEGAGGMVQVHDYSAVLAPFYREFEERYSVHYHELAAAPIASAAMGSLPTSVRTNVNTRRLGLGYEELKALFGPRQVLFTPLRGELDQQARFALMEQLAVKMACTDLDVPGRVWPNHVRATCHKGLKEGRAVLGLRCYPEYYAFSRLLPYHGMPMIEPDRRGAPRLFIVPEISLRGERDLVRVLNCAGEPVLYSRKCPGGGTPQL
jgi:hypothetical protein